MNVKAKLDTRTLKQNGLSSDALFVLGVAWKAAQIAIWVRAKRIHRPDFFWTKEDGTHCTQGDILVTRYILRELRTRFKKIDCITEEKIKSISLSEEDYLSFFSSGVAAIIDGIDGTFFYKMNRSSSIWFALAREGRPWFSVFVELGPGKKGIQEAAIAEAGKGAWLYKPGLGWQRLSPKPWDKKIQPRVGHGIPFTQEKERFAAFSDFLSGPSFRGWKPVWTEIVPIGRACIDVISGKHQLYSHAELPPWDWFPLILFVKESGYSQNWYRIGQDGVPTLLDRYPAREDYHPNRRLCLNIGLLEFVETTGVFLQEQAHTPVFAKTVTNKTPGR